MRISVSGGRAAMAIRAAARALSGYAVGFGSTNVVMRRDGRGLSFPALCWQIAIAGTLGRGLDNAALAISIVLIPGFVRIGAWLGARGHPETYVEASRAIGTSGSRIVWKRVFPNVRVAADRRASLSFGAHCCRGRAELPRLGVQSPDASWGNMLGAPATTRCSTTRGSSSSPAQRSPSRSSRTTPSGWPAAMHSALPSPAAGGGGFKRGLTAVSREIAVSLSDAEYGSAAVVRDLRVEFQTSAVP